MLWLSAILSNIVLASGMALVAWIVQRRLKWHAAARILWALVLVKLVTPPLVSVPVIELPQATTCALGACNCAEHAGLLTHAGGSLLWALLGVWGVGAAAAAAIACRHWLHFRRLLAHARPAPVAWQRLVTRLSGELQLRRAPEVFAVPGRLPPLVTSGWRGPRLILPSALVGRLDSSQRDALVLHELMHLKRGDHLMRLVELAVGVAYWWLPGMGSIGRQLRTCEEKCCDAAVVARLPHGRRDYARLLLDVIDFADPLPRQAAPQVTAMSAAGDLEQRVVAILEGSTGMRRHRLAAAAALGLACALLPCQLQCRFFGSEPPPATLATSDECEPADGRAAQASAARDKNFARAFCCPDFPD